MTEAQHRALETVRAWKRNDDWQHRVHTLMAEGYGFEDVAVRLRCPADSVRAEAAILRQEGRLDGLYATWRRG